VPFPLSAFGPSSREAGTTMPSADFCTLTVSVSSDGAIGVHHEVPSVSCFPKDSYQATAIDTPGPCAGWPVPDVLMTILSLGVQISPDKSVNCPCTTAAFTLSPEPVGFVM
jgi:hypothetical protein